MTITRFLSLALLVAQTAFGQLLTPDSARLADYQSWFDPLNPAQGLVAPDLSHPGPSTIDTPARAWSTWRPNVPPTGLPGPIVGSFDEVYCEVVFLGCTGTGWQEFGYRISGAEGVFDSNPGALGFGAFALPDIDAVDTLDFYVERTDGKRYYAFDKSRNTGPASDGYWGTLVPLASISGEFGAYVDEPFTVFAISPDLTVAEPELFVFAVRAGALVATEPVPEPSTFGLLGAATLGLGAVLLRRRHRTARLARRA